MSIYPTRTFVAFAILVLCIAVLTWGLVKLQTKIITRDKVLEDQNAILIAQKDLIEDQTKLITVQRELIKKYNEMVKKLLGEKAEQSVVNGNSDVIIGL